MNEDDRFAGAPIGKSEIHSVGGLDEIAQARFAGEEAACALIALSAMPPSRQALTAPDAADLIKVRRSMAFDLPIMVVMIAIIAGWTTPDDYLAGKSFRAYLRSVAKP